MNKAKKDLSILFFFILSFLFFCPGQTQAQPSPMQVKKTSEQSVQTDVKTQKKFEAWLEEENELLRQIKTKEAKLELLTWKNEKARQYTQDLQIKVQTLQEKKKQMEQINQKLLPVLDSTVKQVRAFIQTDIPYARAARQKRVSLTEGVLSDYDTNLLVRTQTVFDLLSQEAALGHTTEIKPASVEIGSTEKEVRLLHIGRAALLALGTGEEDAYVWDVSSASFIPAKDTPAVNKALQMAEGKHIIGLVELPLQHSR